MKIWGCVKFHGFTIDFVRIHGYFGRVMKTVKPSLPAGVRDYLPAEMLFRDKVLSKIRETYEIFGFSPIETPAIEREEVLTGGKPLDTIIWRTSTSSLKEGDDGLALHFDLTVPLSRVVAANPELPRPFRRYQCQKVWRGEKPQSGRYREFMQFDADIVGASSVLADAEIVWLMVTTLRNLGFNRFKVRFSTRKVLNALAGMLGLEPGSDQARDLFRILDKQDKIGRDGVAALLAKSFVDQSERDPNDPDATESGLSFDAEKLELVRGFLGISGETESVLENLGNFFRGRSELGEEAVRDLTDMNRGLNDLNVPAENWAVDISVARGLSYYTGPVFETSLLDLPEIGSVMSGGRYDDLVKRFTGESLPATGASIGVDRLFAAMEKLGMVETSKTKTRALVTVMDQELVGACLGVLHSLRDAQVASEIYMGADLALKAQIAYALNQGIRFIVFLGKSEVANGTVQLKDTVKREQIEVPLEKLADKIQELSLA